MAANSQAPVKYCVSCGRQIPAEYNVCPYCGQPQNAQYVPQPIQQESLGAGLTILLYLLSFFIPIVGIIIGIVLLATAKGAERKHVGKICILLGILAIVWEILLAYVLYWLVML